MNIERGLRRLTAVVSALVWAVVTFGVYRSLRQSFSEAYFATGQRDLKIWNDDTWVAWAAGIMYGTGAAAIPWLVFVVGRWVARGFRPDR